MKLLLIKHSNSNHNPHQPPHEWELTEKGIARCKPLAAHIAPYNPKQIFASTMPKASRTAHLVATELGELPIILLPELQEHSRSSNAPYGTPEAFKAAIQKMFEHPDELIFGDETASQAQQRFDTVIKQVIEQSPADENIVVIAHGTVNTLFTALYNDVDVMELWEGLALPSIIILDLPMFQLEGIIFDAGFPPLIPQN